MDPVNLTPDVVALVQWIVNQGIAVAALIAVVVVIGRKLDDGNKLLEALVAEQRSNATLLGLILAKLGLPNTHA